MKTLVKDIYRDYDIFGAFLAADALIVKHEDDAYYFFKRYASKRAKIKSLALKSLLLTITALFVVVDKLGKKYE